MLTPYLPYPLLSGGQIRTYNLLKQLQAVVDVTLVALIKDDSERKHLHHLDSICSQVHVFKRSQRPFTVRNIVRTGFSWYPFVVMRNYVPACSTFLKQLLAEQSFDVIHVETFYMRPHLPKKVATPVVLAEQTIEYMGYQQFAQKLLFFLRPLLQLDIAKLTFWEKRFWRQADQLVVMSSDDERLIQNQADSKITTSVIPNGVDLPYFSDQPKQLPNDPTLVFVGTFKWLPNVEAVEFVAQQVLPRIQKKLPNAQLNIVGNAPPPRVKQLASNNGVQVLGRVEDIRLAFNTAHVLVAPIFSGKGTRYKMLEAMASKTPVVSNKLGLEGLGVKHGKHVLIGETASKLAKLTVQIMTDSKKTAALTKAAYRHVAAEYRWENIGQQLFELYQELGSKRS